MKGRFLTYMKDFNKIPDLYSNVYKRKKYRKKKQSLFIDLHILYISWKGNVQMGRGMRQGGEEWEERE